VLGLGIIELVMFGFLFKNLCKKNMKYIYFVEKEILNMILTDN
jgi:hypothetical protein